APFRRGSRGASRRWEGCCAQAGPRRGRRRRAASVLLRYGAYSPLWLPVPVRLLPRREFDLLALDLPVRNFGQQVRDDVEAGLSLVIRPRHVPWCEGGVGGGEHVVAGSGILE